MHEVTTRNHPRNHCPVLNNPQRSQKCSTMLSNPQHPQNCPILLSRFQNHCPVLENRFRFLKDPYYVGPIDLKLPHRVQALAHVMLLTLLVYSIFEWSVREGLKSEGEPFHVADSYRTFRPRGETVLPDLDDIAIFRLHGPDGISRQLPSNYSRRAERIVRLCGFDMSIYVNPPAVSSP